MGRDTLAALEDDVDSIESGDGEVNLASPAVAAASAIVGQLASPADL